LLTSGYGFTNESLTEMGLILLEGKTRAKVQLCWAAHHHQYKRNAGFQPANNQQDAGGPFSKELNMPRSGATSDENELVHYSYHHTSEKS
jgi:hypothetical protein